MLSNKKVQQIVAQLFIIGRKINIFLVFIRQSYFVVPKHIRINSTYYFIMKNPNKSDFFGLFIIKQYLEFILMCFRTAK